MKKLITICLLIATAFTVNAQNGKPTKEQTLNYLKATIINVIGGYYYKNSGKDKAIISEIIEIKLEGCILKINNRVKNIYDDTFINGMNEIDFSKVESFKFSLEKIEPQKMNFNDNLSLYYDENKSINNSCRGFYCKPEDKEKVIKALNHLRKLCGALEPISFD